MLLEAVLTAVLLVEPIGSGLGDGTRLVYTSGGIAQEPWIYETVRVVTRPAFERCVEIVRRNEGAREYCARGDTLFERGPSGEHAPVRPLGPAMALEVRTASGNVLHFSTGEATTHRIAGRSVVTVPTTVVTRGPDGAVIRRLREAYAPALLTAVWGVFEDPDGDGWREARAFELTDIQPVRADRRARARVPVPRHRPAARAGS